MLALAACGTKSTEPTATSKAESATATQCEQINPVSAAQAPLREATRVKYVVGDLSDTLWSAELLRAANGDISFGFGGQGFEYLRDVSKAVSTDDFVYVQDAAVSEYGNGMWIALPQGNADAASLPLSRYMDEAVIGDAYLGGAIDQLGRSFDLTELYVASTSVRGAECVFELDEQDSPPVWGATITTDVKGRVTNVAVSSKDGEAGPRFIEVGYAPATVTVPESTDIAPVDKSAALVEKAQIARVLAHAENIDREIRFVAAQASPDGEGDPRDPRHLKNATDKGGMPMGATVSAHGADGKRYVVWMIDQLLIFDVASLAERLEQVEVSRDGQDACINLPSRAQEASVITPGPCVW